MSSYVSFFMSSKTSVRNSLGPSPFYGDKCNWRGDASYPEGVPPWRGPVPRIVVGDESPPVPRHANHHVSAVHGVDFLSARRHGLARELLAGNAQVLWPPAHGQPAGGCGLH
jgi:hypothetical protein